MEKNNNAHTFKTRTMVQKLQIAKPLSLWSKIHEGRTKMSLNKWPGLKKELF